MFPCPGKQESWKAGKANHETTFARILGLWSAPPPAICFTRRQITILASHRAMAGSQPVGFGPAFLTDNPAENAAELARPWSGWLIHRQQERSCLREVSRSGGNG